MEILYSSLIGYSLGCISPSAIISKVKHKNLREEGTGNLGATNVTMVMGKGWGVFVMLFDIAKGAGAFLLASLVFPSLSYAGLIAGLFAMLGHIFPFYLRFRGGKGLATFAGTALAYNPLMFFILLAACMAVMFIANYSFVVPYSAAVLFCLCASLYSMDICVLIITAIMGILIVWKHFGNFRKAKDGEDIKVRDYIKNHIFNKN